MGVAYNKRHTHTHTVSLVTLSEIRPILYLSLLDNISIKFNSQKNVLSPEGNSGAAEKT